MNTPTEHDVARVAGELADKLHVLAKAVGEAAAEHDRAAREMLLDALATAGKSIETGECDPASTGTAAPVLPAETAQADAAADGSRGDSEMGDEDWL